MKTLDDHFGNGQYRISRAQSYAQAKHAKLPIEFLIKIEQSAPSVSELADLFCSIGWKISDLFDGRDPGQVMAASYRIYSARLDERLIAYARLTRHDDTCLLTELAVHKAYQHQGVGGHMLSLVEAQLQKDGVTMIALESNLAARKFYERSGYENTWRNFFVKRFSPEPI